MTKYLLLLSVVLVAPLPAQSTAQRGKLILPGTDTLAVFLSNGNDTTRTGIVSDEIAFTESGGKRVIHRVYRSMDRILGARIDTLVDDAASLAPISIRSRSARSLEAIDFRDNRAVGWMRVANGDSIAIDAPVAAGVHGSASFDLVIRSAPLDEKWSADVPAFLTTTRTVVPLRARVDGSDVVDGQAAWRVQSDFGGTPVTFWIDKSTRRLVRQLIHLRPGVSVYFTRPPLAVAPRRNAT